MTCLLWFSILVIAIWQNYCLYRTRILYLQIILTIGFLFDVFLQKLVKNMLVYQKLLPQHDTTSTHCEYYLFHIKLYFLNLKKYFFFLLAFYVLHIIKKFQIKQGLILREDIFIRYRIFGGKNGAWNILIASKDKTCWCKVFSIYCDGSFKWKNLVLNYFLKAKVCKEYLSCNIRSLQKLQKIKKKRVSLSFQSCNF